MALIYLRHLIHGEKAESNDMITYLDKKEGWVEFDPTPTVVAVVPSFLVPSGTSDLPKDFPGRDALVEADLDWADLVGKTSEQLQEIKGIGKATAKLILAALEG